MYPPIEVDGGSVIVSHEHFFLAGGSVRLDKRNGTRIRGREAWELRVEGRRATRDTWAWMLSGPVHDDTRQLVVLTDGEAYTSTHQEHILHWLTEQLLILKHCFLGGVDCLEAIVQLELALHFMQQR